ncbi:MAG: hypothetical protein ACYCQI_11470 [Gammaproteobacteria bacterium]
MTEDQQNSAAIESRERAERLRRIRNLANLSRKDLCDEADININTYIGYEVGRYGGLTKKGAEKIIQYVSTKGVYSTFEWLMHGIGQSPRVVTDIMQDNIEADSDLLKDNNVEKQKIAEEIVLFHKHYKHSIDFQIIDDGMMPVYNIGDYVAGVRYSGALINNLIGSDCIIQTEGGEIFIRNLRAGRAKDVYTLTCHNPQTGVIQPIIYDAKLIFAAKIIWHRRIYSIEDKRKTNEIKESNYVS